MQKERSGSGRNVEMELLMLDRRGMIIQATECDHHIPDEKNTT